MEEQSNKQAPIVAWIENQFGALTKVFDNMSTELRKLKKHSSVKRVHQSRVALRHWFALWSVLGDDGWQTKKFRKRVMKPLNNLLEILGDVRDLDVNLKIADELNCPHALVQKWHSRRKKYSADLDEYLESMCLKKLLKRTERFICNQKKIVSEQIAKSELAKEKANPHILNALQKQEQIVKKLAIEPSSPQEFHKLRLAVKQWRYLLSDLGGTSDPRLEEMQNALGQLHDLDRIKPMLQGDKELIGPLANLNKRQRKLLKELQNVGKKLPFGLAPRKLSHLQTSSNEKVSGAQAANS